MRTRILPGICFLLLSPFCLAETGHEHGSALYHAFTLQMGYGEGRDNTIANGDLDGWLGGDKQKLWLKTVTERTDHETEKSELWALYSRNIDTFWDIQAGLRHDTQPESSDYLVLGINGLAPYFLETEAHLFISENGEVTARLHAEKDLLITQQLILKPYGEVNIDPGHSDGEIGLQLRYEITRRVAPYLDLRHARSDEGEDVIVAAGVQIIF